MNTQKLNKLTDHIYYLDHYGPTDRPILAAIVGRDRVLAVDAGNSSAHIKLLYSELDKVNVKKPDYAALTHWHWDHVFGINEMNIPTFAHIETASEIKKMLEYEWSDEALDKRVKDGVEIDFCSSRIKLEFPDRNDIKLKVPDITFTDHVEIDLGDVTCIIQNVGGDHSSDSCIIYVPQDKVMFLGDCLAGEIYHGDWSWTTKKLFPLLDLIMSYDAEYFVESHGDKPTPRSQMQEDTNLLKSIGMVVDSIGDDKELIIKDLKKSSTISYNDDMEYIVDTFLWGIRKGEI